MKHPALVHIAVPGKGPGGDQHCCLLQARDVPRQQLIHLLELAPPGFSNPSMVTQFPLPDLEWPLAA